ncbi:putative phosphomannomutase [Corynebacterium atrinae]|nr:putative phosphomannomutase [Corynebacterium atrinae]
MNPNDWMTHDPDPITRAEIKELIDASSPELADRFAGPLEFGTAGLRGPIAGGESAMNVATVTRASAGLGAWLVSKTPRPRVVVGCDARHRSSDFQRATAEVLAAAGCEVLLLPAQLPTPVTAFAVRHLDCDAGVMVTASHNPPQDNGYKVYLGGRVVNSDNEAGVQLVSPADKEIAAEIAAAGWADEIPRSTEGVQDVDVLDAYLERAVSLVPTMERDMPIVITAMHGVGGEVLRTALQRAGFINIIPVAEQFTPDPDFPTVAFPNPEEAGALDLAIATAEREGARLILALDPDADRCSVAIPQGDGWVQLTGDQVGGLLGEDAARRNAVGTLACSIVSSRLLSRIAENHGLNFQPTLTGFKWIARTEGLVYGYEEALGYCTDPEFVRDKDGITACLRVADLAARTDLGEFLADIGNVYGWYLTAPLTIRMEDPADIAAALGRLAANPPEQFAGSPVTSTIDLADGYLGLPGTPGLAILTDAADRVIARPSGTEPKLKCYLEVIAESPEEGRARLEEIKRELAVALGV